MQNKKIKPIDLLNNTNQLLQLLETENITTAEFHTVPSQLYQIMEQFKNITGKAIHDYYNISDTSNYSRTKIIKILKYIISTLEEYYIYSDKGYTELPAAPYYHKFIVAISTKDFKESSKDNGEPVTWPENVLSLDQSNKLSHVAKIMPDPEIPIEKLSEDFLKQWKSRVSEYLLAMNDETADVMDIVTSAWINDVLLPSDMITIDADTILQARGVLPRKIDPKKRTKIYKAEDRQKIATHINILANTWINIFEYNLLNSTGGVSSRKLVGKSPALIIGFAVGVQNNNPSSKSKYFSWQLRPGNVFSEYLFKNGRTTILQSQKALLYNYYTQKEEKRLARFLAWEWGNSPYDTTRNYTVKELLNVIHKDVDKAHPTRTVERFETALDTLQKDDVVKSWKYKTKLNYDVTYNWLQEWLDNIVTIEAPSSYINELTKRLHAQSDEYEQALLADLPEDMLKGLQFKKLRTKMKMSLREAARMFNVSTMTIVNLEKGNISKKVREQVEIFISDNS